MSNLYNLKNTLIKNNIKYSLKFDMFPYINIEDIEDGEKSYTVTCHPYAISICDIYEDINPSYEATVLLSFTNNHINIALEDYLSSSGKVISLSYKILCIAISSNCNRTPIDCSLLRPCFLIFLESHKGEMAN